jgi:hypothetical protein
MASICSQPSKKQLDNTPPCLDPLLVEHVALAGLHNHDNNTIGERHLKPQRSAAV